MVLAFRSRDYEMILDMAIALEMDIDEVILDACKIMGSDPNLYSNPEREDDYHNVEIVEIHPSEKEFDCLIHEANHHNYSIETYIIEAMKMYRIFKEDLSALATIGGKHDV